MLVARAFMYESLKKKALGPRRGNPRLLNEQLIILVVLQPLSMNASIRRCRWLATPIDRGRRNQMKMNPVVLGLANHLPN
jgi:hypothetical protein